VTAIGRWAPRLELGGVATVVLSVAVTEVHVVGVVALLGLQRSRLVAAALLPALLALLLVVGQPAVLH
jgi:hypothetical protein